MSEDAIHLGLKEATPEQLKAVPYEAIEFAAGELKALAARFRFLRECLPELADMSRCQLDMCAKMIDRRADALFYDSCAHVWKGWKNPGTPDGPGEYYEYCDLCGCENQEDD
jgi:hypothetical protein